MPCCVPASMEEIDLLSIVLYICIRYVFSAVAVVFLQCLTQKTFFCVFVFCFCVFLYVFCLLFVCLCVFCVFFVHVIGVCRWSFAVLDSVFVLFIFLFIFSPCFRRVFVCFCVFLCVFVHVTGALEGSARPYGGAEKRRIGLGAPRPRQRARTIGESPVGTNHSWVRRTNATSVLPSPHASVVVGCRFMRSRYSSFFWNTRA